MRVFLFVLLAMLVLVVPVIADDSYPLGDVNWDHEITVVDALLIAQWQGQPFVNHPVPQHYLMNGDVNQDNVINLTDAQWICDRLAGLRDTSYELMEAS